MFLGCPQACVGISKEVPNSGLSRNLPARELPSEISTGLWAAPCGTHPGGPAMPGLSGKTGTHCCEVSLPHPTRWQVYFCRKWAQDSGFETCVKKSATWRWRGIFPASGGRRREIGIPGRSGSGLPGAGRERSGRAGSPGPFPEKRGNRRRPFD